MRRKEAPHTVRCGDDDPVFRLQGDDDADEHDETIDKTFMIAGGLPRPPEPIFYGLAERPAFLEKPHSMTANANDPALLAESERLDGGTEVRRTHFVISLAK